MAFRVGVDIGGTFIDFCVFDTKTRDLSTLKVLTTPADPGAEVMEGMQRLEKTYGIDSAAVESFIHGTTVGVNTVIQRKGATMALFTTENFNDVLEVARLRMPESYSLFSTRPEPLVTRDRVFGIRERIRADGSVHTPLDEASVINAIKSAKARGAEGIIVSLLHGFRNSAHEEAAAKIIRRTAPELFVFTSAEIWPVIREYERTTTAIINGYVHPRVADYLTKLQDALKRSGVSAPPLITKSNGGVMSAEIGKTSCVNMVLSGTASGVIGGAFVARASGIKNAITLDIGGTSADVAVVIDGTPQYGMGEKIGEFPLYIPSVSVTSIGDGGGSIARVDEFGVLKVGPESAGSDPGPACYGRGGTRPTITDAFAVSGFLGHYDLAYNSVALSMENARSAMATVAEPLSLSIEEAAEAIINVAISGMYMEINKLTARYGIDIRDFALVTFGGAGPMLGCFLAKELKIRRVIIPTTPGVTSALGGIVADIRNDFVRSLFTTVSEAMPSLPATYSRLQKQALDWLRQEQHHEGDHTLHPSADMRYSGQSFEIEVPLEVAWLEDGNEQSILDAFHQRHKEVYAFNDTDAEVQIMNLRLVVAGAIEKPELKNLAVGNGPAKPEREIEVWFSGETRVAPLYERDKLLASQTFSGPAVIAQSDTTSCIPDGFDGMVDAKGNVVLTWASKEC
jgi:N-methylhydantoinase A